MNLLFINTLYMPHVRGGAELVLRAQAQALARRGHRVTVLTIGDSPGLTHESDGQVSVMRAGYRNCYFHFGDTDPPLYKKLFWHLRDRSNGAMAAVVDEVIAMTAPDLVCCHNLAGWSVAVWRRIRLLKIPLVQVLHDQYVLCARSSMFRRGTNCRSQCFDCNLLRSAHAHESKHVDAVIGVSRFVLERIISAGFFASASIREVLYNAAAGGMPAPRPVEPSTRIQTVRFGFIGTLTQSKGIEVLLAAVSGSTANISLSVAGRGESRYVAELRARHADPRIEFVGYVQPEEFFRSIDVAVVPSLWNDTLPSVVFEALGYGVPVIGSRRGGIPEMIRDGVNGWLFDPDEPQALRQLIERVVHDAEQVQTMTAACRDSAQGFFDMERWLDAAERIFQRCLGPRPVGASA